MAKTTQQTCGSKTITYDPRCSFVCLCESSTSCQWTVSCPDGSGGTLDTSGTGLVSKPPKNPTVKLNGELAVCAQALAKMWKRAVIVPSNLSNKKVRTQTLKGTPEEIAEALGLQLGPKKKR